jgi:Uma2 family endonuclease
MNGAEDPRLAIYRHLRDHADTFESAFALSGRIEVEGFSHIVMMAPMGWHDLNATQIADHLRPQLPPGFLATTVGDLDYEAEGSLRRPDVLVGPISAWEADSVDPRELLLVAEVVSPSNPENDYQAKTREYPAMGIEHYLIADPRDGTCLHQWGIATTPEGRPAYINRVQYMFGDTINLGSNLKLDTSNLRRYPEPS